MNEKGNEFKLKNIQANIQRDLLFKDFLAHFDRKKESWMLLDYSEKDFEDLIDGGNVRTVIKKGRELFEPFYEAFMELKELYPVEEWVGLVDELEEVAIDQPNQLLAKVEELRKKSQQEEVKEKSSEEKDQKEGGFDPKELLTQFGEQFENPNHFYRFVGLYYRERGGEPGKIGQRFLNLLPSGIIGTIPDDMPEEGDETYLKEYLEEIASLYQSFLEKRSLALSYQKKQSEKSEEEFINTSVEGEKEQIDLEKNEIISYNQDINQGIVSLLTKVNNLKEKINSITLEQEEIDAQIRSLKSRQKITNAEVNYLQKAISQIGSEKKDNDSVKLSDELHEKQTKLQIIENEILKFKEQREKLEDVFEMMKQHIARIELVINKVEVLIKPYL